MAGHNLRYVRPYLAPTSTHGQPERGEGAELPHNGVDLPIGWELFQYR